MRGIGAWLHEIGHGEHETVFAENHINWDVLIDLGSEDLRAIGLALGPQKRLSRHFSEQGGESTEREVLEPVYERFSDGFDTADLKDARNLIEKIAS